MDISELRKKTGDRPFQRHPWELARGNVIMDLIRRAGVSIPVDHIVDIGCGDGYIARLLMAKGQACSYSAIDTALDGKIAANLEADHPSIRCYPGTRQAMGQIPPASVFLILDVLEHVPDEKILMAEIKRLPSYPDTPWIITVPACQTVFSAHDRVLGHFRRYNLRQLTTACRTNGLRVEKKGYFFLSLLMVRAMQKLIPALKRDPEDTIQNWKGGPVQKALYTSLLWADYRISAIIRSVGLSLPGLSCYCICRQS